MPNNEEIDPNSIDVIALDLAASHYTIHKRNIQSYLLLADTVGLTRSEKAFLEYELDAVTAVLSSAKKIKAWAQEANKDAE